MKDFVMKHKKIIIFGLVLTGIFGAITALSTEKGGTEIKLTQFITRERNDDAATTSNNSAFQSQLQESITTPTEQPQTPPPTYPDILILFTVTNGFDPGSKNAFVGQKVIWKNDSSQEMRLMELLPKKTALANGVTVAPGQSTEVILTAGGFMTYRELNSGETGRLFVAE